LTSHIPKRSWLPEYILLAALWGASFLFMRLGAAEFGALPSAGVRVTVAALFLLPLLIVRGHWPELLRHRRKLLLLGMLNSGLPFAAIAFALLSISTGLSSLLNATVPLFGALVAWVWLNDRPNKLKILGLLIGFVGVAMLAWGKASFKPDASGLSSGWAVVACLFACLCYGLSASYTRRYLVSVPSLVIATGSQIGATAGLSLPALWLWPRQTPSLTAWLALLAVGVLCTGIAYVLYFRLIEKVGAAGSLTVTFLIPVFAVLYGTLFLDESVTPWMLLCAAVILCGTALSVDILRLRRVAANHQRP
jgi:drug/metabolite transporter (DMT)-like permease